MPKWQPDDGRTLCLFVYHGHTSPPAHPFNNLYNAAPHQTSAPPPPPHPTTHPSSPAHSASTRRTYLELVQHDTAVRVHVHLEPHRLVGLIRARRRHDVVEPFGVEVGYHEHRALVACRPSPRNLAILVAHAAPGRPTRRRTNSNRSSRSRSRSSSSSSRGGGGSRCSSEDEEEAALFSALRH
jgi:hypothetical protein